MLQEIESSIKGLNSNFKISYLKLTLKNMCIYNNIPFNFSNDKFHYATLGIFKIHSFGNIKNRAITDR